MTYKGWYAIKPNQPTNNHFPFISDIQRGGYEDTSVVRLMITVHEPLDGVAKEKKNYIRKRLEHLISCYLQDALR